LSLDSTQFPFSQLFARNISPMASGTPEEEEEEEEERSHLGCT
jgi:hypothetical protein